MREKLLVPTIVLSEALDIAEKGKVEFDVLEAVGEPDNMIVLTSKKKK